METANDVLKWADSNAEVVATVPGKSVSPGTLAPALSSGAPLRAPVGGRLGRGRAGGRALGGRAEAAGDVAGRVGKGRALGGTPLNPSANPFKCKFMFCAH